LPSGKGWMEKPAQLKSIVKKIISGLEEREKEDADILKLWEMAAGKKASKYTKPVFLKSKRLIVTVSNSSWLYNLTLEKNKLLQKINSGLKTKKKIKELQFRIGQVR